MTLDIQFSSDYVEIRLFNALYNRLAGGDGDAYAQPYTDDAEFHILGNQTYYGRVELDLDINAVFKKMAVTDSFAALLKK